MNFWIFPTFSLLPHAIQWHLNSLQSNGVSSNVQFIFPLFSEKKGKSYFPLNWSFHMKLTFLLFPKLIRFSSSRPSSASQTHPPYNTIRFKFDTHTPCINNIFHSMLPSPLPSSRNQFFAEWILIVFNSKSCHVQLLEIIEFETIFESAHVHESQRNQWLEGK